MNYGYHSSNALKQFKYDLHMTL